MTEFTFFEVHFHEFNPTNTAPLLGRGGPSREVARGESSAPDLDGRAVEGTEAESSASDGGSGGPGAGLVVALVLLAVIAVAARKVLGGDDAELAELEEIDDVA